jgi:Ni,Fe-hydrogenase III small subunit/formate hydrogenlyase subunit 6/NADH:ubiquinone oxidoreductase subunit I
MFKILQKTWQCGIVTVPYPDRPALVTEHFRGRPEFEFERWRDARLAAGVCPTGAISVKDDGQARQVTVDYGLCIYCGQCADASPEAVRVTRDFELATRDRLSLISTAEYALTPQGTQERLVWRTPWHSSRTPAGPQLAETIHKVLGRSLAIRQVDAGSCNGCELEIVALNNPVYDIERFGIHFVASPRHADMLLVTGPVTRNMELALHKTYAAAPDPKVVVAVGACGISGGIFGKNYASLGGVDEVIPVDVYIPGCPPRPEALLHGILLAVGRLVAGHRSIGD